MESQAVEHSHHPLQSPYVANKELGQATVEEDCLRSEDAQHRAVAVHVPGSFSHDATSGRQEELERLAANVRAVQREEAAVRLPRAAQLPSVPGLGPVGDGVWPSLEPEYLIRSRDNVRGPRTMIKIIVLIVSIFTVPMAYYLWMGGWDTPTVPTEMASFDSKSIMPQPVPLREKPAMPLREEETTIARGGDHRTPADGAQNPDSGTAARTFELPRPASQQETTIARDYDPRTRKSSLQHPALPGTAQFSGGERQIGTPGGQDLPSTMAAYALDPPQRSSEQETTIAREDDPRTPAKAEPPTAKSSAGEAAGTPGAQDPRSSTARALDLPKPLTQQETIIARDDDPRTPAKGEPRAAKSSAGDTVAIVQPSRPGAQDPDSSTAARALDLPKPSIQQETAIARGDDRTLGKGEPRAAKSAQDPPSSPVLRGLDPEQIKLLMKQGEQFIAAGDVVTARIAFQRAAEAGDANAAVSLGATYDPTALGKLGVVGIGADVAKARSWYEKAEKLGSPDAKWRLNVLADR